MSKLIQKTIQKTLLGIILTGVPFCLYPQTFAKSEILGQRSQSKSHVRPLRSVLLDFESKYKINILFEERLVNGITVYDSLNDSKATVEKNLATVLKGKGLRYQKVKKNSYVIVEEPDQVPLGTSNATSELENTDSNEHSDYEIPTQLAITVTGTVLDENNQPLPAVNIIEKGTTNGTSTDKGGKFTLNVADENAVLVVSFIGYLTEEVAVGRKSEISVRLQPDVKSLAEVVVVGYGSQKKRDMTGAIATVKSEEIAAYPVAGAIQALQGRAAGVQVQSVNGEPGAAFRVRIRGGSSINASSEPLYVIDGFIGGTIPSPEDIASMDVP